MKQHTVKHPLLEVDIQLMLLWVDGKKEKENKNLIMYRLNYSLNLTYKQKKCLSKTELNHIKKKEKKI